MKVLVAGAGGYIGIPTCKALLDAGHEVIALDRYFFGIMPDDRCQIVKHDIRWFDPAILTGVDAVIDLAGLSNDATGDIDPELTRDINVNGGIRLATLAKEAGVKRYVYSSSASVYGYNKDICTEETPVKPLTVYAESKVRVEDALQKLADRDFQVVALRNGTVYGWARRMRLDLVVNAMAARAVLEGVILLMGSGAQRRPFVSNAAVVRGLVDFAEENLGGQFQIFNFAGFNQTIFGIAKNVAWKAPEAKIVNVLADDDKRDYVIDCSLMKKYDNTHSVFRIGTQFPNDVHELCFEIKERPSVFSNPRTITLKWYKHLMDVEKLMIDGRMF